MSTSDRSATAAPSSHQSQFESSPWSDNPAFAERAERIFREERVSFGAKGVYTPFVALATWLWQSLHQESCRAAVMWLTLHCSHLQSASRVDTGSYCRARAKLPEKVLRRLVIETAIAGERSAAASWRWRGREVYLADGTTVSMPDTPENQAEYPQPKSQKKGLGFPSMRLVMILSLATAMVSDVAFGPNAGKETGETSLFRSMLDDLPSGSVVVGDRFYCSYWLIALLLARNVDFAMRLHGSRRKDFRQGKYVDRDDRRVDWKRPARPEWMSAEAYEQIPERLSVRLVRKRITTPGFRVNELIVATNLDSAEYSLDDIVTLYHRRWQVELDIRSIKSTLEMDVLSCKTPENVRREIWMRLLAYNVCREQGAAAARIGKATMAREISLAASLQSLRVQSHCAPGFLASRLPICDARTSLVCPLSGELVGQRPGRCEPREVKRRPKAQKLLTRPRAEARAAILNTQQ